MKRISHPELFFGFVAPIGAELKPTLECFEKFLRDQGYRVEVIKITDFFQNLSRFVAPRVPLDRSTLQTRYKSYIKYGNQLREAFSDDSVLAATAIGRVVRLRNLGSRQPDHRPFEKTAYLLHQFKRKEEVELLRAVYGRLFFQISVYSRRGARVDQLARVFAASENSAHSDGFRGSAEDIVKVDEEEVDETHGQRVGRIFHDADLIVNIDGQSTDVSSQVLRFCEILFSSNCHSPTKMEYGMFAAKAAALRSMDLSRQVGAAIFSSSGEIVSVGCNEVPKAGGGTYWSDDSFDARDWRRGRDPNESRKREVLADLLRALSYPGDAAEILASEKVQNSQFMDSLEYGRVVHAEMSALSDAARLGRSTKQSILFCTTFPCHLCAKHIVAAGIDKVVFLEPYPKSLTADLHQDGVEIEGSDRGAFRDFPAVIFEHFCGITPRRYRELFERFGRKRNGVFERYVNGQPRPFMDIKAPFYFQLEQEVLTEYAEAIKGTIAESE